MGGAGPAVKKGRRADDEGPYHKAEPLRPWGEVEEEDAQESAKAGTMKRRKLTAPRAVGGSRRRSS